MQNNSERLSDFYRESIVAVNLTIGAKHKFDSENACVVLCL